MGQNRASVAANADLSSGPGSIQTCISLLHVVSLPTLMSNLQLSHLIKGTKSPKNNFFFLNIMLKKTKEKEKHNSTTGTNGK